MRKYKVILVENLVYEIPVEAKHACEAQSLANEIFSSGEAWENGYVTKNVTFIDFVEEVFEHEKEAV